jgi:hypothetical protein
MNNDDTRIKNYGSQLKSIIENGYGKTLQMMPSTREFLKMYGNPFNKEPAKLPIYPVLPTQSTYSTVQGTLKTNNNGIGWIVLYPGWSPMSDATCAVASIGALSGDAVQPIPGPSNMAFSSNSVYTVADFKVSGQKAYRIYSLGVRIRYKGTMFNSAGSCYCVQTTQRDDVTGYTLSDIQKNQSWKTYPVNNSRWHSLSRHLTSKMDENFNLVDTSGLSNVQVYEYLTNVQCIDNAPNMLIYITADPLQTFEFEIQSNFEVKGRNLNYHSIAMEDTQGVAKVVEGYSRLRVKDTTTPDHSVKPTEQGTNTHAESTFLDTIKNGLAKAIDIGKKIAPIATTVLGLL